MKTYILLIRCPDQTGLIATITRELHLRDINVVTNNEFVDVSTSTFFMRSEFCGSVDVAALLQTLSSLLPEGADIRLVPKSKKRLVVMVTKEPHCIGDLLLRCAYAQVEAEIVAVIANYQTLEPLVEKFAIPFHFVDHTGRSREQHCEDIQEVLSGYTPDYIILAKYMRILTPAFVQQWNNKIVNIHHSFLPAFIGANPYRQAFERGVKIIGATAHFVNNDLDEGPIIHQDITTINHAQSVQSLTNAGRDVEKIVLSTAVRLVVEERVFVSGNKTIIFD